MKVFIVAALTADGFIARDAQHPADWTGCEDKKIFVRLTKQAGTMIMGARTFASIGRALPGRRTIVYTTRPEDITVTGIETTNEAPAELLERLAATGTLEVAICGGATIYNLFLQAGLVDEMYLTIVPQLFGTGVSLFIDTIQVQLTLLAQTPLTDGAILLHYAIDRQAIRQ